MRSQRGLGALITLALLGAAASCSEAPTSHDTASDEPAAHMDATPTARAPTSGVSSKRLDVALPSSLVQGIGLSNAGLGARITLKYAGAREAKAERDGARVRYRDALGPGFHVTLEETGAGIEDVVELPSAPTGNLIRYEISRDANIAGFRSAHGQIEMLDSNGTPALRVGHAKVIDAGGVERPISLRMTGCQLEHDGLPPWGRPVMPPGADRCFIDATLPAGLVYPARLDPTWVATNVMNDGRYGITEALLPDGRAFVVGGLMDVFDEIATAEVFDPLTETWTLVPSAALPAGAADFSLTALLDGRLLLLGGVWEPSDSEVATALALDTATFTWATLPSMSVARTDHRASLLLDGRVLVSGGSPTPGTVLSSCAIFNPATNGWSATGSMIQGRYAHEAVVYQGRVLVAGGLPPGGSASNTSEIFDPTANNGIGAWGTAKTFQVARWGHAMALLGDSRAIILGGNDFDETTASVQIYDFATNLWSPGADLVVPAGAPGLALGRAARALDGGVVFTGGCNDVTLCGTPSDVATYFDPVTGATTSAGDIGPVRGEHGMIALTDGSLLIMAGVGGAQLLNSSFVLRGLLDGEPCDEGFECASDFCVDSVCCESDCKGGCFSCDGQKTGAADGVCALVTTGTDPDNDCADDGAPNCGQNGVCGEGGECALYDGPGCTPFACFADAECDSGYCVDGICCDTACEDSCYACTAAKKGTGGDGTCGPIRLGLDPDEDCADGAAGDCDALQLCDGFGACDSATVLCAPLSCDATGCLETCSGAGECASGFVCIAETCIGADELCSNESILLQGDGSKLDCAPYRCTPTACKTECASVDDCSAPYVCDGDSSTCILPPADTGGDRGCSTGPSSRSGAWLLFALALALSRSRR